MTMQRTDVTMTDSQPHISRVWAAGCFCFFLVLYAVTSRADVQVSDEAAMLEAGVALATKGVLYIDDLKWLQAVVNIGQTGEDGHLYSKYFPGNTLAGSVLYRLTARQDDRPYIWGNSEMGTHVLAPSNTGVRVALRLNALLGAFGMATFFLFVQRRHGRATALCSVLLLGLGSDWWYQSRGFFSEVGAGAFMLAALWFQELQRPWWSALMLAVSVLFRPFGLTAVPIWMLALHDRSVRNLLSFTPLLASVGLLGIYNVIRFGSPLDFGYGAEGFTTNLIVGLVGVLLSPGRSLFFYSPVLIPVFTGWKLLASQFKRSAWLILYVATAYVLMAASWHDWWGGKAWGSRLLTPILPLLGTLLAPIVDRALKFRQRRLVVMLACLAVLGLATQLLTLSNNPLTVLDSYLKSGYATDAQSIMSMDKNWFALQLRSLPSSNVCTLDAYTLRTLEAECR